MAMAAEMIALNMNLLWITLIAVCGPPLLFGLYIAWLVVPTVVRTVVEEVVHAVNSEFNGRQT